MDGGTGKAPICEDGRRKKLNRLMAIRFTGDAAQRATPHKLPDSFCEDTVEAYCTMLAELRKRREQRQKESFLNHLQHPHALRAALEGLRGVHHL